MLMQLQKFRFLFILKAVISLWSFLVIVCTGNTTRKDITWISYWNRPGMIEIIRSYISCRLKIVSVRKCQKDSKRAQLENWSVLNKPWFAMIIMLLFLLLTYKHERLLRFSTICKILKTCKTSMEECYF